MQQTFSLFIALICLKTSFAQRATVNYRILTSSQVTKLFPDTIRKRLSINLPIFKVYEYADKAGKFYCLLTEDNNQITANKDTFNLRIKAIHLKSEKGSFSKVWEMSDQIIQNRKGEKSIWFWTRYMEFKDFDGDGLADPIIIYGTAGANGYDDGRIKFMIYHKGQKVAIRHQNGVLDFERETRIDKEFYYLPQSLQAAIRQKMEQLTENGQAVFPAGWQTALQNRKRLISEKR